MLKRIQLECRGKSPEEVSDLNLDNCRCTGEPEGLTSDFSALTRLSMVKAGLTTLKGFPELSSLERLDLSDNRISGTLSCLKGCAVLTHLNLSDNRIKTLDALESLAELPNLTHLDLSNCEVQKVAQYRDEVFSLIPSLQFLDGYDANGQEVADSEDEEEQEENGHEENNVDGSEDEVGAEDDDEEDEAEEVNLGDVAQTADSNQNPEDEEEDEEESDVDSEDDDEYGLAYIDGEDIQDDEDDDDYEGGEEQEDEDIDEEDEDGGGESPRGVKRKHQEEEEGDEDDEA